MTDVAEDIFRYIVQLGPDTLAAIVDKLGISEILLIPGIGISTGPAQVVAQYVIDTTKEGIIAILEEIDREIQNLMHRERAANQQQKRNLEDLRIKLTADYKVYLYLLEAAKIKELKEKPATKEEWKDFAKSAEQRIEHKKNRMRETAEAVIRAQQQEKRDAVQHKVRQAQLALQHLLQDMKDEDQKVNEGRMDNIHRKYPSPKDPDARKKLIDAAEQAIRQAEQGNSSSPALRIRDPVGSLQTSPQASPQASPPPQRQPYIPLGHGLSDAARARMGAGMPVEDALGSLVTTMGRLRIPSDSPQLRGSSGPTSPEARREAVRSALSAAGVGIISGQSSPILRQTPRSGQTSPILPLFSSVYPDDVKKPVPTTAAQRRAAADARSFGVVFGDRSTGDAAAAAGRSMPRR